MAKTKKFKVERKIKLPEIVKEIPKKNCNQNGLKWKIRGIQRLLKKTDFPQEARNIKEEELAVLIKKQEQQKIEDLEKKMSLKYRKVKFFEKRKIIRKITQIEKALTQDKEESEKEQLQIILDKLKIDLHYVKYFPKTEPYLSLYPTSKHTPEVLKQQQEIKTKIESDLASGKIGVDHPQEEINVEDSQETGPLDLEIEKDDFFMADDK